MSIISRIFNSKIFIIASKCLVVAALALLATTAGSARDKYETLEAQAFGTGTQMGANIGITLNKDGHGRGNTGKMVVRLAD